MTNTADLPLHAPSARVARLLREQTTFQFSVDTDNLPQGLVCAAAGVSAGVTIVEMGTPLIKCEGAKNVVPAFRQHFPDTLLLADMKTMDGGMTEARVVFAGGGNMIDFLALAGSATAKAICRVRDEFRASDDTQPRLVFADILLPQLGERAVEVVEEMLDAGVDGIGVHLQSDARTANPDLFVSGYLSDMAVKIHQTVSGRASVQVVGGLTVDQACALAQAGLRAFVISANLGANDSVFRLGIPPEEMEQRITSFMQRVRAAALSS